MTKRGETDGFRASSFVERLLEYLNPGGLDAALVNTGQVPDRLRQRYAAEGAFPVEADVGEIESMGIEVIARPLASSRYFMRHDSALLAHSLLEWLETQQHLTPVAAGDALHRSPIEESPRNPVNGRIHVAHASASR
jgi:hypothetical protein